MMCPKGRTHHSIVWLLASRTCCQSRFRLCLLLFRMVLETIVAVEVVAAVESIVSSFVAVSVVVSSVVTSSVPVVCTVSVALLVVSVGVAWCSFFPWSGNAHVECFSLKFSSVESVDGLLTVVFVVHFYESEST